MFVIFGDKKKAPTHWMVVDVAVEENPNAMDGYKFTRILWAEHEGEGNDWTKSTGNARVTILDGEWQYESVCGAYGQPI